MSNRRFEFFHIIGLCLFTGMLCFQSCLKAACRAQGWPTGSRLGYIRYSIWFIPSRSVQKIKPELLGFWCSRNPVTVLYFWYGIPPFVICPWLDMGTFATTSPDSLWSPLSGSPSCDYVCTRQSLWTFQSVEVVAFNIVSQAYWAKSFGQSSSLLVALLWNSLASHPFKVSFAQVL